MRSKLQYLILVALLFMFIASYYLEYIVGLMPCVICEIQRYLLLPLILLSITSYIDSFLICCFLRTIRQLLCGFCLYLGWHHVQILGSEDASGTCLPDIFTVYNYHGLQQAWAQVLQGGPSCHNVSWTLWGVSLPEITFCAYLLLFSLMLLDFGYFIKTCKK